MSKLDIELGIISAVLRDAEQYNNTMQLAIEKKIRETFFVTSSKEIWKFIWSHYLEYKKVPELAVIKRKFDEFQPMETSEPVSYYIQELQNRQKYNLILKGIQQIGTQLETLSTAEAEKTLASLVSRINTEINVTKDSLWNEDVERRKERLLHKIKFQGIDGISYGIDRMDECTGGMHEGELITVVAKEGTGKTYFELSVIAMSALQAGTDVLFISREMDDWQIEQRMDALYFKIPSDKLKLGKFTETEVEEYFAKLDALKEGGLGRLVVSADDEKGFGLTAVQAKIEQHLPNGGIVIIDGSYLLDDEEHNNRKNDYEKIVTITRGLKRMARRVGVTIVQSSQIGRKQKRGKFGEGDAISFSSSFMQDSDVVWELFQDDEMRKAAKMGVHGLKIREGDKPTLILHWNFETMNDFGKLASDATDMPLDGDDEIIIY